MSYLIDGLNLAVLRTIKKPISKPRKSVIDTELVPHVSSKHFQKILDKPTKEINPELKQLGQPLASPKQVKNKPVYQTKQAGSLQALLSDPAVSSIECPSAGKELWVVSAGQRMPTKLVLSNEEIHEFLEDTADKAGIPLLEGVFRAVVDNYFVDAVISKDIGSRFVIRKQTPYSLLEG
ncbi:MAG: hypothetical protein ACP5D2_00290 [Candidatus Nanoarchaeia archaeon]